MKKLWKGNLALVEGAIAGGLEAYFGYPITPQNEIPEYLSSKREKHNIVFLQAESELASINMVMGAALTGKKAMTSSSSPGISLMQESISYLVGMRLPCVIVNIQRGGPGLGNISGAQGDYLQTVKGGGHGDYKIIVITPGNVQEMYDFAKDAFSLAFKYRLPVMILADGVLAQMVEPANIPDVSSPLPRVPKDYGWNLTGCENREPRMIRSLFMDEGELEDHNYEIWDTIKEIEQELRYEETEVEDADVILVGYGSSARINFDVYKLARAEGYKVGYFRLKTVVPFPSLRLQELGERAKFLVVEMSMGQMVEDVKLSVNDKRKVHFYGRPGGGLLEIDKIFEIIKRITNND